MRPPLGWTPSAVGPERLLVGSAVVGVGGCVALLLTPAVRRLCRAAPTAGASLADPLTDVNSTLAGDRQ